MLEGDIKAAEALVEYMNTKSKADRDAHVRNEEYYEAARVGDEVGRAKAHNWPGALFIHAHIHAPAATMTHTIAAAGPTALWLILATRSARERLGQHRDPPRDRLSA